MGFSSRTLVTKVQIHMAIQYTCTLVQYMICNAFEIHACNCYSMCFKTGQPQDESGAGTGPNHPAVDVLLQIVGEKGGRNLQNYVVYCTCKVLTSNIIYDYDNAKIHQSRPLHGNFRERPISPDLHMHIFHVICKRDLIRPSQPVNVLYSREYYNLSRVFTIYFMQASSQRVGGLQEIYRNEFSCP